MPSEVRSAASVVEPTVANDAAHFLESSDSARCALTDFRREHPLTVEASSSIDDAFGDMNRLSIHALLVTRQAAAGGIDRQVVGLITYLRYRTATPASIPADGCCPRGLRIPVEEVMTPSDELPLVKYELLHLWTPNRSD